MKEKRSVAALKAVGYGQARKAEKSKRLDELVALTQYTRRHARRLMSEHGKQLWLKRKTKLVGDLRQHSRRERARVYDEQVVTVLIKLWKMMDYICGKRLQPALAELISVLERHNELRCERETRAVVARRPGHGSLPSNFALAVFTQSRSVSLGTPQALAAPAMLPPCARTSSSALRTSASMLCAMPGYCTLTATARPSRVIARCTCPMEAAAKGSGSQRANTRSGAPPSCCSTTDAASSGLMGGALCWRRAIVLRNVSGMPWSR